MTDTIVATLNAESLKQVCSKIRYFQDWWVPSVLIKEHLKSRGILLKELSYVVVEGGVGDKLMFKMKHPEAVAIIDLDYHALESAVMKEYELKHSKEHNYRAGWYFQTKVRAIILKYVRRYKIKLLKDKNDKRLCRKKTVKKSASFVPKKGEFIRLHSHNRYSNPIFVRVHKVNMKKIIVSDASGKTHTFTLRVDGVWKNGNAYLGQ